MSNQYRKKPVVIEAVRVTAADFNPSLGSKAFDGCPFSAVPDWLRDAVDRGDVQPTTRNGTDYAEWIISTLEGDMLATAGDWIIRGVKGGLYPCKHDIFEATYEAVT